MSSRHQARATAFQILYRYDGTQSHPIGEGEISKDLAKHFSHFQVPKDAQGFVTTLVSGVLQNLSKIDQILEQNSNRWKISRMPSVDRCILRLATFELLHLPQTASTIVIDEAVELGKEFGSQETAAFINGVLGGILKLKLESS